jgi:carbon-monoxide dehydrogenase large subunit
VPLDTAVPAAAHRYVGQSIKRVEDPRLLAGKARFVDDLSFPGMVHASFVRSPHAHARIVSIDTSAAKGLDGVVAVFTGEDLCDLNPFIPNVLQREELLHPARHPLPRDKARFVGEAVAVVVATTPYIAEDGRDLVDINWEPLPVVVDPEKALEADAPLIDESLGTNNVAHIENAAGDVERAFSEADHVFTKRFVVGRSTGAPVGMRGVIAEYDERGGGHLTIYPASQFPHLLRLFLAPVLGIPEGRITIKVPDVGGAFGLTCSVFPEDAVVPALAMRLGRPVKWIEDRYENLASSAHSKGMVCTVEIAVDKDGTFRGFRGHFICDAGAYAAMPFTPLSDSLTAAEMLPSVYTVNDVAYKADNPLTNKCQNGPIRGVGWVPGQLVRETAIDDVARALGADPVELRLKNMIGPEPRRNAFGASYDGGSYTESVKRARDAIGYEAFRKRQVKLRQEGRYVGVGFSPFVEPTGWATRSSRAGGMPGGFFDCASVTMEPDGSVNVTTGFHSHGQGHETTFAQVAADELGVPIEMVRVRYGDTDAAAWGMGTYASRSAVIGTGAIVEAAGEVRQRLLEMAGALLEASPEDIELRDSSARVKGAPSRSVPIGDVAGFGYFGADARPEAVQRSGLTATSGYDPGETYANGCAAAVVEVDPDTGAVKVEQLVAVEDCGVVLNPMIVKGQVAGALAMGLGIALLEDLAYDDQGEFVSGTLMHYLYPTTGEVPMVDYHRLETPSPASVQGVKGVGEAGTIATPPAIINAIADALSPFGISVGRAPVTPTYIRELLREATGN